MPDMIIFHEDALYFSLVVWDDPGISREDIHARLVAVVQRMLANGELEPLEPGNGPPTWQDVLEHDEEISQEMRTSQRVAGFGIGNYYLGSDSSDIYWELDGPLWE
jgi:hypothetical protein